MRPKLLFATRNPHKAALFCPIFADYGIRCVTLRETGLEVPPGLETGSTPEENALIKARAVHGEQWPWVFGDDAGLEIDALGGEPGLQARRWGGRFPDDVDDATWLRYLLRRLDGVPLEERTARWVAGWALIGPDGSEHTRRVQHEFTIAERPIRPMRRGSPVAALEIHAGDHLAYRRAHLAAEWADWGVLEEILGIKSKQDRNY
jgi:XTP/dITP diphosphohydrolase